MSDVKLNAEAPPAVSIVLPTYNEQGNIVELIRRLDAALDGIAASREILVIDDASPDGTADAVRRVAEELPHARVIVREERGLTTAIQHGIDEARGEIVVWMDCDLSMPPEVVPELIERVRGGADVAVGSRYVPGSSEDAWSGRLVRLQKFATRRLNRILTFVVGADFHDWTSGFIAIRSPLVKSNRLRGDYGEYFIDLMARIIAGGARFVEVPYRTVPRAHGESKTAPTLGALARLGPKYLRALAGARRTIRRKA